MVVEINIAINIAIREHQASASASASTAILAEIIPTHVTDTEDIAPIDTGTGDDKTAAKHADCADQIPPQPLPLNQPLHLSALMRRITKVIVGCGSTLIFAGNLLT